MSKYRYRIIGCGRHPIERVELVSETAQFATIISNGNFHKNREFKVKKAETIFLTFEEARADWQRQLQIKVDSARASLRRANDAVGRAKGLKNPYEENA